MRILSSLITLCACHGASAIFVTTQVTHAACGFMTGTITVSVSGGVAPYAFLWSPAPPNGQGTSQVTDLGPGDWTVEVFDSGGESTTVTVTIIAPLELDLVAAIVQSSQIAACPGMCNGQLFLNTSLLGGAAPYTITTDPPMDLNALCANAPFQLNVTDANGCDASLMVMIPEVEYPQLLGTIVEGPCPGEPTGVEVFFSMLVPFSITSPDGLPIGPSAGPNGGIAIHNPPHPPGVYTFTFQPPPCPAVSFPVILPGAFADCADLEGRVFVDVDGDCAHGGTDFGLAARAVGVEPGGHVALTDFMGRYRMQLPFDDYTLTFDDPLMGQVCAVQSPVDFTLDGGSPQAEIDIALEAGDTDLEVNCAIGQAVVGFTQVNWITVHNNSTVPSGPITVTFDFDEALTYGMVYYCGGWGNGFFPWWYPNAWAPGQATWEISDGLGPMEQRQLRIDLNVPPDVTLLGTVLDYVAEVSGPLNDVDPANNNCMHGETVVGSYDPNDKLVRTSTGGASEWSLEDDEHLTYTIRFQNTGTAPAVNVVLDDTLSAAHDLATLRILGASHAFQVELLEDRVLRFTFPHIMLPDSNSNEPASHGYAQFRIAPMAGLQPGDTLTNAADIFFDFNPPIRTNTTLVEVPLSTSVPVHEADAALLFPNPADDLLFFHGMDATGSLAEVFGTDGRLLQRARVQGGNLDVGALPPGLHMLRLVCPSGNSSWWRFVKH